VSLLSVSMALVCEVVKVTFFPQLKPKATDTPGMKTTIRNSRFGAAKLLSLLAVLALPAASFIGCGGDGGESSDGDSDAHCTGSPNWCSVISPPGCGRISGCSMRSTLRWNGTWENYCDGTPDSCSSLTSAESCKDQGCKWE